MMKRKHCLALVLCALIFAGGTLAIDAQADTSTAQVSDTKTSGDSNLDQTLQAEKADGTVVFEDNDITVTSYGDNEQVADAIANDSNTVQSQQDDNTIGLQGTAYEQGEGGVSRLNSLDGGRAIAWSVKPNTAWPYAFGGNIHLAYNSGFVRDQPIAGTGVLGSTVSGLITLHKNHGGHAKLTGEARDINLVEYKVMPDVKISF